MHCTTFGHIPIFLQFFFSQLYHGLFGLYIVYIPLDGPVSLQRVYGAGSNLVS